MASRYLATVRRAISIESLDNSRRNMLIAVRFARVFGGDDAADFLFDAFARHIFAVAAFESALEKELELKKPLRRVHIFVGRRAAHGGFMHVDIFGDVAQHHGL